MTLFVCLRILVRLRLESVVCVHILHTQSCTQLDFIPRMSVLSISLKVFLLVIEVVWALCVYCTILLEEKRIVTIDKSSLDTCKYFVLSIRVVFIVCKKRIDINVFIWLRIEKIGTYRHIGCREVLIRLLATSMAIKMCPIYRKRKLHLWWWSILIIHVVAILEIFLFNIVVACFEYVIQQICSLIDFCCCLSHSWSNKRIYSAVHKKLVLLIRLPWKINACRISVSFVCICRLWNILVSILNLFVTIIHRIVS